MKNLLIIEENADEYAKELRKRPLADLEVSISEGSNPTDPVVRDANIILGRPDLVAKILGQAERLEWVQSSFAGIEPFCAPNLRKDYILTGVKDVFGPLMSEYVFGYILALERNIFAARENQKQSHWRNIPYRGLAGLTIGICGLGSIGRHIASTASHFRMRVLGLSRSAAPTPYVERVFGPSEIAEFANHLDYLVAALPNTPSTKHLISAEVFKNLQKSAVLINVGRGMTVDEDALVKALRDGKLRAAVLDVFDTEPLPSHSLLWKLENAYVTPHNSALTFPKDIADIFCDNYERFRSREPLKYLINLERGY